MLRVIWLYPGNVNHKKLQIHFHAIFLILFLITNITYTSLFNINGNNIR